MRSTKDVGDLSQAMALATLLKMGKVVLQPYGDNQRYDLVVDDSGLFTRVQCKTGRTVRRGAAIDFPTCSSYRHRGRGRLDYRGTADVFSVYSPTTDLVYFVPVSAVGSSGATLRLTEPRKKSTGVRWAKDFLSFPNQSKGADSKWIVPPMPELESLE